MSVDVGFASVGVLGAGLIGGSVALRLQETGVRVVVDDPDAATRERVAAAGLELGDPLGCDLVLLATPLDVLPAALERVAASRLGTGSDTRSGTGSTSVVVDVGSTKAATHRAASAAGLADRYVGLHPMNGTELAGFAHADAALVTGITWAVTFAPDTGSSLLARVGRWLVETFEATVVVLDADAHDRAVAAVSQLPHAVAHALLAVASGTDDPAAALLAAGSFRDGTRVAGTQPERTHHMLAENRAALVPLLEAMIEELGAVRDDLADGSGEALRSRLQDVAARAATWRDPHLAWAPCADLEGETARHVRTAAPLLVRSGPDGLETATLG